MLKRLAGRTISQNTHWVLSCNTCRSGKRDCKVARLPGQLYLLELVGLKAQATSVYVFNGRGVAVCDGLAGQ